MAYIDCNIDTEPMARELDSVSRHVDMTTAAVVSMRAAVIAAEKEGADMVCENVNRGFHTMMRSQVSQKVAKLKSDVDSHLLHLNQLTKQLVAIKSRMEVDYQRTGQRYSKLFGNLNKELRKRVQELDQPVFKFATVEVRTNTNRVHQLCAMNGVMQSESITEAQRILSSNIKYHSMQVLECSRQFVQNMMEQKILTDRILLSEQGSKEAAIMLPVVISECNNANHSTVEVFVPSELLDTQQQAEVKSEVFQNESNLQWKKSKATPELKNEFARLVANSSLKPRVKETINRLMDGSSEYLTF